MDTEIDWSEEILPRSAEIPHQLTQVVLTTAAGGIHRWPVDQRLLKRAFALNLRLHLAYGSRAGRPCHLSRGKL